MSFLPYGKNPDGSKNPNRKIRKGERTKVFLQNKHAAAEARKARKAAKEEQE